MSTALPGPSTPIVPSSRQPTGIPRTPSSTLPHPSTRSANSTSLLVRSGSGALGSAGSNTTLHSNTSASSLIMSSKRISKYDKNLSRKSTEVSLSSFAFIFSEAIQYMHKRATGIQDFENRLNQLGYHIGQRALELVTVREGKSARRETKVLSILQFIHTTLWKTLFGRSADALERSADAANEYMIIDFEPMITQFISVPRELSQLNCAAFAAGAIEAVLDGSQFTANVTAHTVETDEHPLRTVFLIKFDPLVIEREK
ncbi:Trs31p [Sugiyamaella lignohabitans]|uniref:Trs31p n=1 Tax=Sugiyamaella lignohabitans TaxID=796027 RepID=A0A161HJU1_9ASCO|nr:Trs31p [Sugiyamaella lignohabitans]ANB13057.1 Trs31p [Sugiyamaella lignohabitans]